MAMQGRSHSNGDRWRGNGYRAVPRPRCWHGGTIRHSMTAPPCLTVLRLAMTCFTVPVPCRAWVARLDNYNPPWMVVIRGGGRACTGFFCGDGLSSEESA